ncbi:hemolysin XhlA family protein [Aquibacillus kalidii]|uniref:hemolysin XhlA family protein n=1 Tax=Aquibacillus kalidii TaxID=2762597 RepID=UPI0016440975|nr:hemolysin XhlA family protein [Aquibacillus kalidii]
MENLQYATREELKSLEDKVTILDNRQTRTETRIDNLEKKIDKIDSNTTWILRLIVGAVIGAFLKIVLTGGI